ncbi:MAG: class I SAM-dependent methyltransferase [Mariniblastus sp.]
MSNTNFQTPMLPGQNSNQQVFVPEVSGETETSASSISESRDHNNTTHHEAQDNMALLPNYYSWICSSFKKHLHGDIVELGVGAGLIIKNYINNPNVKSVLGIDFNEILLDRLNKAYPDERVNFRKIDLRAVWNELPAGETDCALALDVIEHFEDDSKFAEQIHRILKPGGIAIIKVPAQPKLFSSVDECSGHYRRYLTEDLGTVMSAAGFETLEQKYFNLFGSLIYPLKKKKKSNFSKTFSPWKIKIANVMIPGIAFVDNFLKIKPLGLKGLSVVGIYQKPTQ